MASPSSNPAPPPTSALPQLPVSKIRTSMAASDTSRPPSISLNTSKLTLRQPSKIGKPSGSTGASPVAPHPASPGLTRPPGKSGDKNGDSEMRRSVSIASFPQPPKARKSLGPSSMDADPGSQAPRGAAARSEGLRIKKLKTKASTGSLNSTYTGASVPSLLNNNGHGKSISGSALRRESSGLASMRSRPESSNSSGDDSYSTSATTFEDGEDKRQSDEHRRGRDSGMKQEAKGNVIVSVRIRPDAGGDKTSAKDFLVDGRQSLIAYKGREAGDYYYDNVFTPHDRNHKVYDSSAKRLVRRVMEGYHGTVFAYGMTGTGKTFSMQGTRDSPGVIPLAITDIFSYIRETPSREFLLRVSYLEIYNEKIQDLLAPAPVAGPGAPPQEEIKLREDGKRGVFASPLKEEIVQSPTQLLRVIARGDQCRKTRSTQFNAHSSRSHAVVQIVVESRERATLGGKANDKRSALVPGGVRVSTLSMIDLAGSERAADNKERQKEGAHINKSLLTLGTVVSKLSSEKDGKGGPPDKDGKHLPYRDSKLTRLLQPALSGNSLISILCTIQIGSVGSVATAHGHIIETLNTLKFAARARNNIVSHAKRAEEALGSADGTSRVLLERYQSEIQDLRGQLESQKRQQAEKEEAEKLEQEMGINSDQRHEEQMLEIHLARTALQRRMDDLKRLILSSQSSGVNSQSKSTGIPQTVTSPTHSRGESTRTIRSLRTSASQSTLGKMSPSLSRNLSLNSHVTEQRIEEDPDRSPTSSFGADEEEDVGDENATYQAQISSLQNDLADKNRYIATLEKRLLQARRSSQSRASLLFSPSSARSTFSPVEEIPPSQLLMEKDAEIADLRARLEDKDRMVAALRSAARNRDLADPSILSAPASPPQIHPTNTPPSPSKTRDQDYRGWSAAVSATSPKQQQDHRPQDSTNSTSTTSVTSKPVPPTYPMIPVSGATSSCKPAPTTNLTVITNPSQPSNSGPSPVQLLSPKPNPAELDKESKRKSIDEMTKILDGMIQDRVQTGTLVVGQNGAVRTVEARRKESLGHVPSIGQLAAQLRSDD